MISYDLSELALDMFLELWQLVKSKEISQNASAQSDVSAIFAALS